MLAPLFQYDFSNITIPIAMPLISAVLVFALAISALFQNLKSTVNILFSFFSICIGIFLIGTFMLFISHTDSEIIFWDRFIYMGVIFLPISLYHFGAAFAGIKPPKKLLLFGYLATPFFLIISRTDYFVSGIFRYAWGVHTKAQFFHHVFLVFFAFYITRGISYIRLRYKAAEDPVEKNKAKYAFYAFVLLFIIGSLGYLPAYGISIYPFAYLSGLIFVLVITYSISKYNLFNLKAIAAEIFVFFISTFFLIQALIISEAMDKFIHAGFFVLSSVFGYFLIQSVFTEASQREKLEKLTKELKYLNDNLQLKVAEQTEEVRRAYAVEKKARIETEELDKAKDQFILTTQHHLRTPLTIIKGFIETAIKEGGKKMGPEVKSYLNKAEFASDRMAKLINDFLGISQLEVGKAIFNFKPQSVKQIIEEIKEEIISEAEKKKLDFKIDFTPEAEASVINIDRESIKAAFFNLIDNAVKYTPEGSISILGSIVIHPIEKIKILRVEVKDTGIGILKEEQSKIFNRYFQRGEEAEKIYTTGRGIGLVLTKNIIKAHHGEIFVNSGGKNQGASFTVELPFSL